MEKPASEKKNGKQPEKSGIDQKPCPIKMLDEFVYQSSK